MFGLCPGSWLTAPTTLATSQVKRARGVLCYVNEGTDGPAPTGGGWLQGIQPVIRGLELSDPPP